MSTTAHNNRMQRPNTIYKPLNQPLYIQIYILDESKEAAYIWYKIEIINLYIHTGGIIIYFYFLCTQLTDIDFSA